MNDDDALNRAKRALVVSQGGRAVTTVDKTKVDDLLARARAATQKPPPVIAKEPVNRAPTAPALEQPREAPRNPPPAVVERPKQPPAIHEAHPVAPPATSVVKADQTVIVNVTIPAPYPTYPYQPGWWWWPPPAAYTCPTRSCPLRAGRPCHRWFGCPYV